LLGAALALLALGLVVSGIVRSISSRHLRLLAPCVGLAVLLLSCGVLVAAGWAQTYRALGRERLVATVQATAVPGVRQTMQVVLTPVTDGKEGRAQVFTVKGDEWQLSADIITWQDWLNILGLRDDYRLTALSGYFEAAHDRQMQSATTYDLSGSHDVVSRFVHHHPDSAPLLHMTTGVAVRMLPSAATYQVYLSPTGGWTAQI
jgi:hypothetical protein